MISLVLRKQKWERVKPTVGKGTVLIANRLLLGTQTLVSLTQYVLCHPLGRVFQNTQEQERKPVSFPNLSQGAYIFEELSQVGSSRLGSEDGSGGGRVLAF